ncbi:hypothetical protein BDV12DRAFT_37078 [Aspergillus spectabilis]
MVLPSVMPDPLRACIEHAFSLRSLMTPDRSASVLYPIFATSSSLVHILTALVCLEQTVSMRAVKRG